MHLWQKSWKRSILLDLVPLTLLFGTWQSWMWWNWAKSAPIQTVNAGTTANHSVKWQQIQIPPRTASQQIGRYLEKAGLIRISYALRARYANGDAAR